MKSIFAALFLALALAGPLATSAAEPAAAVEAMTEGGPVKRFPEKAPVIKGKANKVQFALTGMTCQACAETIASLLSSLDGVVWAEVDLKSRRAEVEFDDAQVKPERMLKKIKANGYGATISAGS